MAAEEIYQIYRRYVGAINAGRWDQMPEYIADPAVFDGVKMSPLQYGQTIASFSSTCESFYVELLDVVIDATQGRIAAKLVASGKPIMEFFGFQPTGNQVRFNQVSSWVYVQLLETS